MKFGLGLVIGKFLPPHRGHRLLIDTATARSVSTVVVVCAKPTDFISGEIRAGWLRELHPSVQVQVINDREDENEPRIWAENTRRWLGRAPDAIFSSEDYGGPYAAWLGATHVLVDRDRRQVPVSGSAIRADPLGHWDFLDAPVRGALAKRVCVLGAKSTGTTTLAQALATHFSTEWVAEYGREYSGRRQGQTDAPWRSEEFVTVAIEQSRRENAAARRANRVLICDTNALATVQWHRRYMGTRSPDVEALAREVHCDLYLLTGDEIPFVADGLRDGADRRHEMQGWFEAALAQQATPWRLLRGSRETRLAEAVAAVQPMLATPAPLLPLPVRV